MSLQNYFCTYYLLKFKACKFQSHQAFLDNINRQLYRNSHVLVAEALMAAMPEDCVLLNSRNSSIRHF